MPFINNKCLSTALFALLSLTGISWCAAQTTGSVKPASKATYSIAPEPNWTRLFNRQTGWTGGDGIYSIALPASFKNDWTNNKKENILFLFSDSVIDSLVAGKPSDQGFTMIHNAVATLNGTQPMADNFHFYWPKTGAGTPASVFIPDEPDNKGSRGHAKDDSIYYWLGDALALSASDNKSDKANTRDKDRDREADTALAIFAYKMINTSDDPFGFKEIGNELLLTNARFQILSRVNLPVINGGSFGAGIYRSDISKNNAGKTSFIYIYGVHGPHKGLIVARTTQQDLSEPGNWEYYTGNQWSKNIHESKDITAHVSNELSVTRTPDGQYALIYQLDGIQPYIGMKLAPTPYGPFGAMDTLWHCQEPDATNKLLVYNAKAHPDISPKGALLISYNVNSLDFLKTLKDEPTFYRPRFLMLRWKAD